MSERRACRVVRQWRGTQRYLPLRRADEDQLTQAILALAAKYGRYGYRRITVLLRDAGWQVGKDRVQRIWQRERLKVPQKQRARGRLWLGDGSCVRLRPERANHVWSYDFVKAMTHDGRALRILVVIDEYTRECLALRVARRLGSLQVIENLADPPHRSPRPGRHPVDRPQVPGGHHRPRRRNRGGPLARRPAAAGRRLRGCPGWLATLRRTNRGSGPVGGRCTRAVG